MTGAGGYVEVQGTAETTPFTRPHLDELADLAWIGIQQLTQQQHRVLESSV
jgi:ribonuclease PH